MNISNLLLHPHYHQTAKKPPEGLIFHHQFPNFSAQMEFITNHIKNLVNNGFCQYSDITILVRKNDEMLKMAEPSLTRFKYFIPFTTDITSQENKVKISTVHRYKGLENKVIFVLVWNFPKSYTPQLLLSAASKTSLMKAHAQQAVFTQEENKLFYVALTRPQERLFLLSCSDNDALFQPFLSSPIFQTSINYDPYKSIKHLDLRDLMIQKDSLIGLNTQIQFTPLADKLITQINFLILDMFAYQSEILFSADLKMLITLFLNKLKRVKIVDFRSGKRVNLISLPLQAFFHSLQYTLKLVRERQKPLSLDDKEEIKNLKKNPDYRDKLAQHAQFFFKEKPARSLYVARLNAEEKANMNFSQADIVSFLTLTVAQTDYQGRPNNFGKNHEKMQYCIEKFTTKFRKQYAKYLKTRQKTPSEIKLLVKKIKYMKILETHKSGHIHYHLLFNCDLLNLFPSVFEYLYIHSFKYNKANSSYFMNADLSKIPFGSQFKPQSGIKRMLKLEREKKNKNKKIIGRIRIPVAFQWWADILKVHGPQDLKPLNSCSQNLQVFNKKDKLYETISEAAYYKTALTADVIETITQYIAKYVAKGNTTTGVEIKGTRVFYNKHLFHFSRSCQNPIITHQIGLYPNDFIFKGFSLKSVSMLVLSQSKKIPLNTFFGSELANLHQKNRLADCYFTLKFGKTSKKLSKKSLNNLRLLQTENISESKLLISELLKKELIDKNKLKKISPVNSGKIFPLCLDGFQSYIYNHLGINSSIINHFGLN